MSVIARKAVMFISLMSYLLVSSSLIVHASPTAVLDSDTVATLSAMPSDTDMPMDCHSDKKPPCDDCSTSCQVVCAAVSHVLLNPEASEFGHAKLNSFHTHYRSTLVTRKVATEPQPPKQLF